LGLKPEDDKNKIYLQLIWGALLLLAGVGVFFRIPQVMPQIKTIPIFASIIGFIYFCFYLLGILLMVGGARKIYANLKALCNQNSNPSHGE
jgi:cobalamin biosynthesis protein CobD/CbiB